MTATRYPRYPSRSNRDSTVHFTEEQHAIHEPIANEPPSTEATVTTTQRSSTVRHAGQNHVALTSSSPSGRSDTTATPPQASHGRKRKIIDVYVADGGSDVSSDELLDQHDSPLGDEIRQMTGSGMSPPKYEFTIPKILEPTSRKVKGRESGWNTIRNDSEEAVAEGTEARSILKMIMRNKVERNQTEGTIRLHRASSPSMSAKIGQIVEEDDFSEHSESEADERDQDDAGNVGGLTSKTSSSPGQGSDDKDDDDSDSSSTESSQSYRKRIRNSRSRRQYGGVAFKKPDEDFVVDQFSGSSTPLHHSSPKLSIHTDEGTLNIEELIPEPNKNMRQSPRKATVEKRAKITSNLYHNLFLEPTLKRQATKRHQKELETRRRLRKEAVRAARKEARSRTKAEQRKLQGRPQRHYLLDDFALSFLVDPRVGGDPTSCQVPSTLSAARSTKAPHKARSTMNEANVMWKEELSRERVRLSLSHEHGQRLIDQRGPLHQQSIQRPVIQLSPSIDEQSSPPRRGRDPERRLQEVPALDQLLEQRSFTPILLEESDEEYDWDATSESGIDWSGSVPSQSGVSTDTIAEDEQKNSPKTSCRFSTSLPHPRLARDSRSVQSDTPDSTLESKEYAPSQSGAGFRIIAAANLKNSPSAKQLAACPSPESLPYPGLARHSRGAQSQVADAVVRPSTWKVSTLESKECAPSQSGVSLRMIAAGKQIQNAFMKKQAAVCPVPASPHHPRLAPGSRAEPSSTAPSDDTSKKYVSTSESNECGSSQSGVSFRMIAAAKVLQNSSKTKQLGAFSVRESPHHSASRSTPSTQSSTTDAAVGTSKHVSDKATRSAQVGENELEHYHNPASGVQPPLRRSLGANSISISAVMGTPTKVRMSNHAAECDKHIMEESAERVKAVLLSSSLVHPPPLWSGQGTRSKHGDLACGTPSTTKDVRVAMRRGRPPARPLDSIDTISIARHEAVPVVPGTENTQGLDVLMWLRRMRALEFLQLANDVGSKFAGIAVLKDLYSNEAMPPHVSQMIADVSSEAMVVVRRTLIDLFSKSKTLGGLGLSPDAAQLVADPILSKMLTTLQDNEAILLERREDIRLTFRNGTHFDLPVLKDIIDQTKNSYISLITEFMQESPNILGTQSVHTALH